MGAWGPPPYVGMLYTRVTTDQENELLTTSTTDKALYTRCPILFYSFFKFILDKGNEIEYNVYY